MSHKTIFDRSLPNEENRCLRSFDYSSFEDAISCSNLNYIN